MPTLNHNFARNNLDTMQNETETYSIDEIITENTRRNNLLKDNYDPISGMGACGNRTKTTLNGGEIV